ncbi:efflux RND transporter periplasmic adaptor subunit [Pseudogemmobacter sonorensis]|uniref:efflux RND transporter periplasmic adaptor subunit n=1 Tax=Pseudogemmobacter sonorensis TaxID=2989681 RepID=UPI003675F5A5
MRSRILDPATFVFAAIVLLVVLWIGSGIFSREEAVVAEERPAPVVAASWSEARPVERKLVLYGEVQPTQIVTLRSRVDGLVEEIAEQGRRVAEGDVLGRLSADDREAKLAQARAQLAVAEQASNSAQSLADRGITTSLDANARQAELEAARAALRAVELEIENTTLRAPISGVINRVLAESGSYVSPGGEVLEIVNNDPLLAIIQVQQSQITNVVGGMPARVTFIGGETAEGRVRFVAPLADAATRTFRVEVEVDNPGGRIPAGISAEVELVTETVEAHYISMALLRIDAQGRIGVYVLDGENRTAFRPIGFVAADASGVWISGLGAREHLVTISQGALAGGQVVEVRETPAEYLSQSPGAEVPAGPEDPAVTPENVPENLPEDRPVQD